MNRSRVVLVARRIYKNALRLQVVHTPPNSLYRTIVWGRRAVGFVAGTRLVPVLLLAVMQRVEVLARALARRSVQQHIRNLHRKCVDIDVLSWSLVEIPIMRPSLAPKLILRWCAGQWADGPGNRTGGRVRTLICVLVVVETGGRGWAHNGEGLCPGGARRVVRQHGRFS